MDCDFSEKVSLLIDRELSPAEAERMKVHISECPVCRQMEQDFLGLSHQIKSYEFDADPIARRQTLWKVLASQSVPLWRKKIALPAPVFALVVFALLAFGAWFVIVRNSGAETREAEKRVTSIPLETPVNKGGAAMDLSRFDRGERAIVYKERRAEIGGSNGKGAGR